MASRILDRRELRKQADVADAAAEVITADGEVIVEPAPAKKSRKAKTLGPPKPRKARAKKAPPRMCVRWGIFDNAMKQVAVFDYNQRPLADEKLADFLANRKGSYFIQVVKEAMPEVVVAEPSANA